MRCYDEYIITALTSQFAICNKQFASLENVKTHYAIYYGYEDVSGEYCYFESHIGFCSCNITYLIIIRRVLSSPVCLQSSRNVFVKTEDNQALSEYLHYSPRERSEFCH